MVEMELVGVRLELPANTPIVLLREQEGRRRVLPIYIGGPEAAAIAYALEGVESPAPLTHDLMKNVLDELGVHLVRVLVTDMREHTYFAELHLERDGQLTTVSSRPSDSIALAVRTGSPIYAVEHVVDEYAQEQVDEDEAEPPASRAQEEILEEFRDFIENVNPEDFQSR